MPYNLLRAALRPRCALAAAIVAISIGQHANADVIPITTNLDARISGKGKFTGTIDYSYDAASELGRLLITINNNNPSWKRGYITGIIFNLNSIDPDAQATLIDAPDRFLQAYKRNGGPFGWPYDAGAALQGRFLGGGKPHYGMAAGSTGVFEFQINASDAASLGASNFLGGEGDFDFLVRFRGFRGGGGDIAPAQLLPEPSTIALLGLASMAFARRRRSNPS